MRVGLSNVFVMLILAVTFAAIDDRAAAQARFPLSKKKVEDLGPQAAIKLAGNRIVRTRVSNDPGFRLHWHIKQGEKTLAQLNARGSDALVPALESPGNYRVVLELYFPVYRTTSRERKGEFRSISNVLEFTYPLPPAPSAPVRVAGVVGGHVHPAVCVTKTGQVLAVYNKEGGGGKELLLCRSNDGGTTWSEPAAIPVIKDCSIYPGSLTTLADGRVLLQWSCYRQDGQRHWRVPQFCLSNDEGRTWTEPRDLPITDHTNFTCLRHPVVELSPDQWVCPLYDRTIVYNAADHTVQPFGDGRNHGMVPIVRTATGSLISGAPEADAGVPVGVPGTLVKGLRSTDGGKTWEPLGALPRFGVAGYDLTVLRNGWVVLTYIVYGIGQDGEWSYRLAVSRDDGVTWDYDQAVEVYSPGRRIAGRGWPRSVQLDDETLGTLFYDLDSSQPGGPGVFFVRTPLAALALDTTPEPQRPTPPH